MTTTNPLDSLNHLLQKWYAGFETLAAKLSQHPGSESASSEALAAKTVEESTLERDIELVCDQFSSPIDGWLALFKFLDEKLGQQNESSASVSDLLDPVLAPVTRSAAKAFAAGSSEYDSSDLIEMACRLYAKLDKDSICRNHVLATLAWLPGEDGLRKVGYFLTNDPPGCAKGIPLLFAPMIRRQDIQAQWLFPELFAGIAQVDLGTAIIDYSNFLYRQRGVRPHPASARLEPLAGLLATATQQLLTIEQDPRSLGEGAEKVSQVINDSVGLITALCDALALNGDKSIVGKIFPAMQVTHRRVKLEAAAALARLGEEDGVTQLVELAEQAVVRRRVVEYAKELGVDDKIDDKFKTAEAMAETELALWLAHPSQMGVAPYKMEVVDSRKQFWPGFEQPVECTILSYVYPFQPNAYENVGLVGPITHSFSTSISGLPAEDIYAVFAGWHVEHEEIFAGPVGDASIHQQGLLAQLRRRVQDQGLEIQSEELLGCCLGEWALVARGSKSGESDQESRQGWVVADLETCFWLPLEAGFERFDENFAWYLYLGRKLLREFNGPAS